MANKIEIDIVDINDEILNLEIPFCDEYEMEKNIICALSDMGKDMSIIKLIKQDSCKYKLKISDIVSIYTKYGTNKESFTSGELLYLAVQEDDIESLKILIDNGSKLEYIYKIYTPLKIAVEGKKYEILKILISAGANVNNYITDEMKISALEIAVIKSYTEAVKILLDAGAKTYLSKEKNNSAIFLAIRNLNLEILELLLTKERKYDLILLDESITHIIENNSIDIMNKIIDYLPNMSADLIRKYRNTKFNDIFTKTFDMSGNRLDGKGFKHVLDVETSWIREKTEREKVASNIVFDFMRSNKYFLDENYICYTISESGEYEKIIKYEQEIRFEDLLYDIMETIEGYPLSQLRSYFYRSSYSFNFGFWMLQNQIFDFMI